MKIFRFVLIFVSIICICSFFVDLYAEEVEGTLGQWCYSEFIFDNIQTWYPLTLEDSTIIKVVPPMEGIDINVGLPELNALVGSTIKFQGIYVNTIEGKCFEALSWELVQIERDKVDVKGLYHWNCVENAFIVSVPPSCRGLDGLYSLPAGITSFKVLYNYNGLYLRREVTDIQYYEDGAIKSFNETGQWANGIVYQTVHLEINNGFNPDSLHACIQINTSEDLILGKFYNYCSFDSFKVYDIVISNLETGEVIAVEESATAKLCTDTSLSTWYFAEGYTGQGFDEWILLMNPNAQPVDVKLTAIEEDGSRTWWTITIPASSRYSVHVNDIVSGEKALAFMVESLNGEKIIAERSMYWDVDGVKWAGGHSSVGTTTLSSKWYLAEGSTEGFDEYILIMNPNSIASECKITFCDNNGNIIEKSIVVGSISRKTIHVNTDYPEMNKKSFSTTLESTNGVGIVVERSMYWYVDGKLQGGHNSIGIPE